MSLHLVATCALGLESFLAGELTALGMGGVHAGTGAVAFCGGWRDAWRANWWLRTANRVLVELAAWEAPDGDALAAGAEALVESGLRWEGVVAADLFHPDRTFAVRATSSHSQVRDVRWVALKVKDGLVDGQRGRWGRRASVDRDEPAVALRVWLSHDRATLLLDTSGEPLDRRGYRREAGEASLRETLAAAAVLASGWDGKGAVVDPMCGAGTLLAEAGGFALGRAPGTPRRRWAFEKLPGFDRRIWEQVRAEPPELGGRPEAAPSVELYGTDLDPEALAAARANLERAGLGESTVLLEQDGFDFAPPPGGGLLVVNPPYGERMEADPEQWRRLGDLLKRRYRGWKAVVLAGDPGRGKWIGLAPRRRYPVRNGPLDARILVFDLY